MGREDGNWTRNEEDLNNAVKAEKESINPFHHTLPFNYFHSR